VTSLSNTCEGTSGTAVSASNSAGPNQFDSVSISGTGTAQTWDSTHAHAGSTAMKNSLPSGVAAQAFADWTASISPAPVANAYARVYVYLTAYPGINTRLLGFVGSAATQCSVQIGTTGLLRLVSQNGTTIVTSTAAIPLNAWCRIEMDCTSNTGTTANLAARMFSGANLETGTPDSGGTVTSSAQTTTAQVSTARFGQTSATQTSAFAIWLDDIAFSDTAAPGPSGGAAPPSPVTVSALPQFPAVPRQVPPQVIPGPGLPGPVTVLSADSGHAAETGSVPGSPAGSDTAHAAEAASVQAAAGSADTGHAAEAGALRGGAAPVIRAPARPPLPRPAPAGQVVPVLAAQAGAASADAGHGAEAASLHVTLSGADTAHAAEAASSPGGANVSGHDAAQAAESAFYYHSGADSASGAEGAAVRASGADSAHAAEFPARAWPSSADAAKAAERGWQSGPLASADTAHAAEAVRPFPVSRADSVHCVEVLHEMGIWTFLPVNVRLEGRFWLVTGRDARDREVVLLEAERLDAAVLRLAQRLLLPVPYRHDAQAAGRLDDAVRRMAEQGGWVHLTRRLRSADAARSAEHALAEDL
jgi:hypothetical protein